MEGIERDVEIQGCCRRNSKWGSSFQEIMFVDDKRYCFQLFDDFPFLFFH